MKLLRYGLPGKEKPGILDSDGKIRDLSGSISDIGGPGASLEALDEIRKLHIENLPLVEDPGRIGPCVSMVPNFYCIGLNYAKHAAESGLPEPEHPVVFNKATSALSGPYDDVILPRNSVKSDWEVELGVIIGREALYVSEAQALNYVSGYCTINDLSERTFQIEMSGQWVKGKSAPTFGPVGPWFVTADEVPDPQKLQVSLSLNGEVVQNENTADMIFSVAEIVSHMSQFMKLMPGDIISTGTPSGVGLGMKPQRFLKPGDVMEVEVEGLGRQRQTTVAAD